MYYVQRKSSYTSYCHDDTHLESKFQDSSNHTPRAFPLQMMHFLLLLFSFLLYWILYKTSEIEKLQNFPSCELVTWSYGHMMIILWTITFYLAVNDAPHPQEDEELGLLITYKIQPHEDISSIIENLETQPHGDKMPILNCLSLTRLCP